MARERKEVTAKMVEVRLVEALYDLQFECGVRENPLGGINVTPDQFHLYDCPTCNLPMIVHEECDNDNHICEYCGFN